MNEIQQASIPEDAILVSEVHVIRYMDREGNEGVSVGFHSHNGQQMGPIEILGMLQLAQHTSLNSLLYDEDDDDEDDGDGDDD